MKRMALPLTLLALVALSFWVKGQFFSPSPRTTPVKLTNTADPEDLSAVTPRQLPAMAQAAATGSSATETTSQEQEARASLNTMSAILKSAISGQKLENLVQQLRKSGQDPIMTRQNNGVTGELTILRTQNPLPGTRYFHAQYFTDENNERYVQHMSFEFKPGPHSMSEAVKAAMQNFSLGAPSERRDDFVQWELEDNYVLWIKRKSLRDLQNDPFKANDPKKDLGTVQMALEQNIHDADTEGHGH